MNIQTYLNDKKNIVEDGLAKYMAQTSGPFKEHVKAMRYSLFIGGKRVRPILCLAAGEAIDNSLQTVENLLPIACALECIHTYSLIHDDLPAMDNDTLRRGKPTNHTLYGEAGAILAGDGLLTWAFELLSAPKNSTLSPDLRLAIIHTIAAAAGPFGMVGGQALDIASENIDIPFDTLRTIHKNKTGALITCAVHVGAVGASASDGQTKSLITYGDKIGLAFQIVDDLLNVTATTEELGKSAGSDAARGKATYPAFFGIAGTRSRAKEAVDEAIDALSGFGPDAEPLRALAKYILTRGN
ncbi:MAG: polyprenyl synthetase family protein [Desulforhopalus sp.]